MQNSEPKPSFKLDIVLLLDRNVDQRFLHVSKHVVSELLEKIKAIQSEGQIVLDVRYRVCGFGDHETHPADWWTDNLFTQDSAAVGQQITSLTVRPTGVRISSLLDALWRVGEMDAKTMKWVDDNPLKDTSYGADEWRTTEDWALVRGNSKRVVVFLTPNSPRPTRSVTELHAQLAAKYIQLVGVCPLDNVSLELSAFCDSDILTVIDSGASQFVGAMTYPVEIANSQMLQPLVDKLMRPLLLTTTAHPPGSDVMVL